MELKRGQQATLKFSVPSDLVTALFTVEKDGVQVGSPSNATLSSGVAEADVPYAALFQEGHWTGVLNFVYQAKRYRLERGFDVVTPHLESWELQDFLGDQYSLDELQQAESIARHIINAHTGQTFGSHDAVYHIRTDSSFVMLPERLIRVNGVTGLDWYEIGDNGWTMRLPRFTIPPVRADYRGLNMTDDGVITNNDDISLTFPFGARVCSIDGHWGWDAVPAPVVEATQLLINDNIGEESQYRDRYLDSMTAADWRIQFNAGAFAHTGNARADALLADFVIPKGAGVI